MNYETIRTQDLTAPVALYPTSLRSTGPAEAVPDRPWGTPEGLTAEGTKARTGLLDQLIQAIANTLDVLQPAHRAGTLLPGDTQQMQRLELWYSELQAEKEHVGILSTAETKSETI